MVPSSSPNRLPRRTIFALCCAGMIALSFAFVGEATLLSSITIDLALDDARKGLFLSALFWGFPVAVLVSGPAADRFGFRLLLVAGALFEFTGFIVISWADTFRIAVLGAVLLGVGCGVADALLTPIVCATYPDRRTRISNLLHAFYPIGVILTIGLLLALMNLDWSWRTIFRVLGMLVLPYGLAAALFPLPESAQQGPQRLRGCRLLLRLGFVFLLLGIFFAGVTEIGPSSWLPHFVERETGSSQTTSAGALLLFGLTMTLGRFSAASLGHHAGPLAVFAIGGALSALSLLMAALPVGTAFTVFWLCVLGFGVAGFWPTILGCAGDRYPHAGASMYSLLTAGGILGGIVGPLAVGFAARPYGLRNALALLAIAPVAATIFLLPLRWVGTDAEG